MKDEEEKKEKLEIGILYFCIYSKLCERVGFNRIISKRDCFHMMSEVFHIPRKMQVCVLKEMELKGLIKDLGQKRNANIFINRVDFNLEKDANKFYDWLGIFGDED